MPILGYKTDNIGTLRLWQSEAIEEFDFQAFNEQHTRWPCAKRTPWRILPACSTPTTAPMRKAVRLKQQYFLSSASLQDILFNFKRARGSLKGLADTVAIQLNDTHAVVSIPELIRLLMLEGQSFEEALKRRAYIFLYQPHRHGRGDGEVDVELFKSVIPEVFDIIYRINARFCGELMQKGTGASTRFPSYRAGHTHGKPRFLLLAHRQRRGEDTHRDIEKRRIEAFLYAFPRTLPEQDQRRYAAPLAQAV
jgi:starch phosphorylase